jgi:hypothetical protein
VAVAVAVAVGSQRERFSAVVEAAGWQGNCVRWISCEMGVGVSGDAKWQKYGCEVKQSAEEHRKNYFIASQVCEGAVVSP